MVRAFPDLAIYFDILLEAINPSSPCVDEVPREFETNRVFINLTLKFIKSNKFLFFVIKVNFIQMILQTRWYRYLIRQYFFTKCKHIGSCVFDRDEINSNFNMLFCTYDISFSCSTLLDNLLIH